MLAGGFRRILVRLDEATRRKYCGQALYEDLTKVQDAVGACVTALGQAKQVQDASKKLAVHSPEIETLLVELETMRTQLAVEAAKLLTGDSASVKDEEQDEQEEDVEFQEAKLLAKQVVQVDNAEDIDAAVDKTKELQRLMPVSSHLTDKRQRWWKRHIRKAVDHLLGLIKADKKQLSRPTTRLLRVAKKATGKCPELESWFRSLESGKTKPKKRLIALPDDGETAVVTSPKKRTKGSADASTDKSTPPSVEERRSLLHRCAREVRSLRDKFDLAAYDANLSRAVTIIDALWPGFNHSELVALTTTLCTLVETAEKIGNLDKRRDRLVCLQSVLAVVIGHPTLKLSGRRKTMLEEYAKNCRQSLEQLNRPSAGEPSASPSSLTMAGHVRFG